MVYLLLEWQLHPFFFGFLAAAWFALIARRRLVADFLVLDLPFTLSILYPPLVLRIGITFSP
jgi:hypothetical protein